MAFLFDNFSYYEFEQLCCDVLKRLTNDQSLRYYPPGRDEGIDIANPSRLTGIVGQVKHMKGSPNSKLITELSKEVQKITPLAPQSYYILCSNNLTLKERKKIVELFKPINVTDDQIIDGNQISDFLQKGQNSDIVATHYKLWLTSQSVLSILDNQAVFIDSEALIDDIKKSMPRFVQTSVYARAHKILEENNVVIITGEPGIGKTTTSNMLIASYLDRGYSVRYASNSSIAILKKSLSRNVDAKQIILIDDYLGQHYLEIKHTTPNEIKSLITFAKGHKNTKLILNSRITITREAQLRFIDFEHLLQDHKDEGIVIDHNDITRLEKARIFYNHLYFSDLDDTYYNAVLLDQYYLSVISHKNYNPRIIEYVTNVHRLADVSADDYPAFITDKLENPKDVWRNEFEDRMEPEDRLLLECLYTLSDRSIPIQHLQTSFEQCVTMQPMLDPTRSPFTRSLKRLSDGMISLREVDGTACVSVSNPSINDFLREHLRENRALTKSLLNSVVFCEQVTRLSDFTYLHDAIKSEFIAKGGIDRLDISNESQKRNKDWHYIRLAISTQAKDAMYDARVTSTLASRIYDFEALLLELIEDHDYCTDSILSRFDSARKIEEFLDGLGPELIDSIYLALSHAKQSYYLETFSKQFGIAVESFVYTTLEGDNWETISETLDKYSYSKDYDGNVEYSTSELWESYFSIEEEAFRSLMQEFSKCYLFDYAASNISFDPLNYNPIVDWNKEISYRFNDDEDHGRWAGQDEGSKEFTSLVKGMFEGGR